MAMTRRRWMWIIVVTPLAVIAALILAFVIYLNFTRTWEGEAQFTVDALFRGRAEVTIVPGSVVGDGDPITTDMSTFGVAVPDDVRVHSVVVCQVSQEFTPNTDFDRGPRITFGRCRAMP